MTPFRQSSSKISSQSGIFSRLEAWYGTREKPGSNCPGSVSMTTISFKFQMETFRIKMRTPALAGLSQPDKIILITLFLHVASVEHPLIPVPGASYNKDFQNFESLSHFQLLNTLSAIECALGPKVLFQDATIRRETLWISPSLCTGKLYHWNVCWYKPRWLLSEWKLGKLYREALSMAYQLRDEDAILEAKRR